MCFNPKLFALTAFLMVFLACAKAERRFESVCQIVRSNVVEKDDKDRAEVVDVELEWDPCPGDQFQMVRGGQDFAACMQRYEVGSFVPVLVKQWWDDRGYYTWDVYKVGDCSRTIEPGAEGSYEKSQDCSDTKMYGATTGFFCSRRPFEKLLSVCSWMARN